MLSMLFNNFRQILSHFHFKLVIKLLRDISLINKHVSNELKFQFEFVV